MKVVDELDPSLPFLSSSFPTVEILESLKMQSKERSASCVIFEAMSPFFLRGIKEGSHRLVREEGMLSSNFPPSFITRRSSASCSSLFPLHNSKNKIHHDGSFKTAKRTQTFPSIPSPFLQETNDSSSLWTSRSSWIEAEKEKKSRVGKGKKRLEERFSIDVPSRVQPSAKGTQERKPALIINSVSDPARFLPPESVKDRRRSTRADQMNEKGGGRKSSPSAGSCGPNLVVCTLSTTREKAPDSRITFPNSRRLLKSIQPLPRDMHTARSVFGRMRVSEKLRRKRARGDDLRRDSQTSKNLAMAGKRTTSGVPSSGTQMLQGSTRR